MKTQTISKLMPIALLAFSMLFLLNCKKDRIEPTVAPLNTYSSLNSYFDTKKQQEQEFIITGPSNDTIVGNQGTRIYPSKNCLRDANLDTVDYPYTLKLVELYTPADMIYYQMPTVAGGNILETDGEIRLRAFKNNLELTLTSSCPFPIEMPNSSPKSYMSIYLGTNNGTFVDWANSSTPFTTNAYGYLGLVNTLGWINCDFQVGTGTGHTLSFTSLVDDLTNVGIFVYFPATKTVMQVYNQTSGLIPNGSNVKIVLLAIDGSGGLHSYTSTQTINASNTLDITLNPTTDAAVTAYLNGL